MMFVPVSCTNCGKPFQVPEAALGKLAPCPWCGSVVTALPVSAPVAAPEPQTQPEPQPAPAPPEPQKASTQVPQPALSLDDAEPTQQQGAKKTTEVKIAGQPTPTRRAEPPSRESRSGRGEQFLPPPGPAPKRKLPIIPIFIALIVLVVGAGATVVYRNYGSGRVSEGSWREFTPPDGSFTIKLPGIPEEESLEANPIGSVTGGRRYSVRAWYSKTTVWVAYADLEPGIVPKLPGDRDRVISAGVLQAERERERARLGGTITSEVGIRHLESWGILIQMDTPRGKVVEWLFLKGNGAHPRVYVYGIEGKDIVPDSPAARRLDNSFKMND